jgi:hypothetical protein
MFNIASELLHSNKLYGFSTLSYFWLRWVFLFSTGITTSGLFYFCFFLCPTLLASGHWVLPMSVHVYIVPLWFPINNLSSPEVNLLKFIRWAKFYFRHISFWFLVRNGSFGVLWTNSSSFYYIDFSSSNSVEPHYLEFGKWYLLITYQESWA